MNRISTKAWVLYKGPLEGGKGILAEENISFSGLGEGEILVEPIYGCWEANMSHALERNPVDICRVRGEEKIVLGNAGVVRVLKASKGRRGFREGDFGLLVPIGECNDQGNVTKVYGYDARNTIGMLAKRTKVYSHQLIRLEKTKHSLRKWSAFSVRYANAWANWKISYGCWLQNITNKKTAHKFVCGWGGGVSLAEVTLAKLHGWEGALVVSSNERLTLAKNMGLTPIDRREFSDLFFDPDRFECDKEYRRRYFKAEWEFLKKVRDFTGGVGISIFIDNIGTPVYRATLKALGNQGVITTCGWKFGMFLSTNRVTECMNHRIHVFTHGSTYDQGVEAMHFAEKMGWLPPVDDTCYQWSEIPMLAQDFQSGKIQTYFPIFQINPE